jgi:hypothetical protein
MKMLLTFQEFLNESLITEGNMAKKVFADKKIVSTSVLSNAWGTSGDPEMKAAAEQFAKKLGIADGDISQVMQSDENSEEETALGGKIFDFLEKKFKQTEIFDNDMFDAEYDAVLNVTRITDEGFIAYQFTVNSNF